MIGIIGAAATRRSGRSDGHAPRQRHQSGDGGAGDARAEGIVHELRVVGQERTERARRRDELRGAARFPLDHLAHDTMKSCVPRCACVAAGSSAACTRSARSPRSTTSSRARADGRASRSTTSTSTSAPRPARSWRRCSPSGIRARRLFRAALDDDPQLLPGAPHRHLPLRRAPGPRHPARRRRRDPVGGGARRARATSISPSSSPTSATRCRPASSPAPLRALPRALLAPPRAADALRRGAARAVHHRQRSRLRPPRHLRAGRARRRPRSPRRSAPRRRSRCSSSRCAGRGATTSTAPSARWRTPTSRWRAAPTCIVVVNPQVPVKNDPDREDLPTPLVGAHHLRDKGLLAV